MEFQGTNVENWLPTISNWSIEWHTHFQWLTAGMLSVIVISVWFLRKYKRGYTFFVCLGMGLGTTILSYYILSSVIVAQRYICEIVYFSNGKIPPQVHRVSFVRPFPKQDWVCSKEHFLYHTPGDVQAFIRGDQLMVVNFSPYPLKNALYIRENLGYLLGEIGIGEKKVYSLGELVNKNIFAGIPYCLKTWRDWPDVRWIWGDTENMLLAQTFQPILQQTKQKYARDVQHSVILCMVLNFQ